MAEEKILYVKDLSALLGCTTWTINNWYMFKNQHPEHELAKKLPEVSYTTEGVRKRYWKLEDVEKIAEFQKVIPQGNKGLGVSPEAKRRYYAKLKNLRAKKRKESKKNDNE